MFYDNPLINFSDIFSILMHRRSSPVTWNCCREEHLSDAFCSYYWKNNTWCTLHQNRKYAWKIVHLNGVELSQKKHGQARNCTKINLAPIQTRFGEGNGSNNRPTPYIAMAKKWRTKDSGRGIRAESRATGPLEQIPAKAQVIKTSFAHFFPCLIGGSTKHFVECICQCVYRRCHWLQIKQHKKSS